MLVVHFYAVKSPLFLLNTLVSSVGKTGSNILRNTIDTRKLARHYSDVKQARWCLKSPASRLFTQFIQVQIKENIKAPRHWPLCGEFTGGRRIPPHKWPVTRKMFPFDDDVIMREDDTSPITCCLVSRAQSPSKPVSMLSGWGHTWCVFSEFKSEYDLFAKFCTHDCVTYHRVRTSPVYQVAGWLLCARSHTLQASLGIYSMNEYSYINIVGEQSPGGWPFCAETKISLDNYVNTTAANTPAPCVARTLGAMILTVHSEQDLVCPKELQLIVLTISGLSNHIKWKNFF